MKVDEALALLREADPAAGTEPAWAPPVHSIERPPHRGPRVWLAAIAAAVLVAAVAGAVALTRGGDSRVATPAGFIRPGAPDPHRAVTEALVRRVFDAVRLPPGSTRRSSAPLPTLAQASISIGNADHLVTAVGWWTAPGTVTGVREYVARHAVSVAPGTFAAGDYDGVYWETTDGLTIHVAAVGYGSGVAMRVDVLALWLPSRTTDYVIGAVTSVDATVTVEPSGAHTTTTTIHRTLTGTAAARVARASDRAKGAVQLAGSCPLSRSVVRIDLRLRTARGAFTITIPGGCWSQATITTPGGASYLVQQKGIVSATYAALGLPADYGSR